MIMREQSMTAAGGPAAGKTSPESAIEDAAILVEIAA